MADEQESNASCCGAVGRALFLPLRGIIYVFNPCNWCNSADKMKSDIRLAFSEVGDGHERIALHASMLRSSCEVGMDLLGVASGAVVFTIPRHMSGKIYKMKKEELLALEQKHPNFAFRRNNIVFIEIDIEEIQRRVSGERAIISELTRRVREDLTACLKGIGGEKYPVGDGKLMYSIAKLLHDSHNYTNSVRKDLITSNAHDDGVLFCIANKGIMSGAPSNRGNQADSKMELVPEKQRNFSDDALIMSNVYLKRK